MKSWAIVLLSTILAFGAGTAMAAGPAALTDEELDLVSAGGVQFGLTVNPDTQLVDFFFDLGQAVGNGTASVAAPGQPSNLTLNGGSLNLSGAALKFENLILNMNICWQCQANTILQQGLGVPISIRAN